MAETWERLPDETPKAFIAFHIYRDTEPINRSIAKCVEAQKYSKATSKIRLWAVWSSKYRWVERVEAYDRYADERALMIDMQAEKEMRERHINEAKGLQKIAIDRLKAMRPEELKARDVLSFFIEASKLERLAMGLETEHLDVTSAGKRIKKMTDDELSEYIQNLLRAVDSGVGGSGQAQL